MALTSTVWPNTGVATELVKTWLSNFYKLADADDSSVGEEIVNLFTEGAIVSTAAGQTQGKAGNVPEGVNEQTG